MNRKKIIRDLLFFMEDFGREMLAKKFEQNPCGMPSNSQMDVLMMVYFHGPQSIKKLAQKLHMTPSGATQLVNILVKEGFLTRMEDKADRRMVRLELTKKADNLLIEAKKRRMEEGRLIFANLDENELVQLDKTLRKIVRYLQASKVKK